MGMGVIGNFPATKAGACFRDNNGAWYALVDYILKFCPAKITNQCEAWYYNNGDGLTEDAALALAVALRKRLRDGHVQAYAKKKKAAGGFTASVKEFCSFLEHCGGFRIF